MPNSSAAFRAATHGDVRVAAAVTGSVDPNPRALEELGYDEIPGKLEFHLKLS